jgi:uncharacterized protein YdeI (YjbR/CyaY-like superfamily)
MPEPHFFATPADLRDWFDAHAGDERELLVGFWKRDTGRPSVTWPEAVDEALCVGWIDGVRRSLGDEAYSIRFTPRKVGSTWSAVNVAKVQKLLAEGRMRPAGLAAWEARREDRTAVYSYEQADAAGLTADEEAQFRADAAAWSWFEGQAPSYRRAALHLVTSAKRPDTRARRLGRLIEDSAAGRRLRELTPRRGAG